MCRGGVLILLAGLVSCHLAGFQALDIVSGKSGEEQVKEALDKAEKESERAAAEQVKAKTALPLVDTAAAEIFSTKKSDHSVSANPSAKQVETLKQILERQTADALAGITKKPKNQSNAEKEIAKIVQDRGSSLELSAQGTNEKDSASLKEDAEKRMTDMARKLNTLVLKFQRKMDHLQHRPKTEAEAISKDSDEIESSEKILRGKTASNSIGLDIAALTKMGGGATSYKEDTKLEDRLAMEAEEEKKFSNGDTYDYGDGEASSDKSTASAAPTPPALSPKEQATQEMQSYNALISSESNRELSQIQEEITKATQSSMGQVSVVGQKQEANAESPSIPGLGGLQGLEGLGANQLPPGSIELGGGEGMETGAAAGSEISSQQTSTMADQGFGSDEANISPQELANAAQTEFLGGDRQSVEGGQKPIEIGGDQNPVEMGTIGAPGALQQSSESQMEMTTGNEEASPFEGSMGRPGAGAMDAGGLAPQLMGGGQIQQMAFKKSKISGKGRSLTKRRNSASTKSTSLKGGRKSLVAFRRANHTENLIARS